MRIQGPSNNLMINQAAKVQKPEKMSSDQAKAQKTGEQQKAVQHTSSQNTVPPVAGELKTYNVQGKKVQPSTQVTKGQMIDSKV